MVRWIQLSRDDLSTFRIWLWLYFWVGHQTLIDYFRWILRILDRHVQPLRGRIHWLVLCRIQNWPFLEEALRCWVFRRMISVLWKLKFIFIFSSDKFKTLVFYPKHGKIYKMNANKIVFLILQLSLSYIIIL